MHRHRFMLSFLAVQNSSIDDIVTGWVIEWHFLILASQWLQWQLTITDRLRNLNHGIWGLVIDTIREWPRQNSLFLRCFYVSWFLACVGCDWFFVFDLTTHKGKDTKQTKNIMKPKPDMAVLYVYPVHCILYSIFGPNTTLMISWFTQNISSVH